MESLTLQGWPMLLFNLMLTLILFNVCKPMAQSMAHLFPSVAIASHFLIDLFALVLLLPISVFAIECIAAIVGTQKNEKIDPDSQPSTAILIPAHNESLVISNTLNCLMGNLAGHERVVVVADNCTDDTAAIARSFGVTVLERHDYERRGKGYALDFGLGYLAADAPEVVIVIDADCLVQPGAVQSISHLAAKTNRPVQACYLMEQPPIPTPKSAVSALAFLVKNWIRPLGLQRMTLPCLLTGTGMAFPWSALQTVSLASGNIVEDMQLAVDLAIAGQPPLFCEDALVIGCLPQQDDAAAEQRKRWEHGHLQTLLSQIPRLLAAFFQKGRFDLLAMAVDFSIPPLSLLTLAWIALMSVAVGSFAVGVVPLNTLLAIALEGMVVLFSVAASWLRFGRSHVSAKALLAIPLYILWKIPLYFAFLIKPQAEWVRTARDSSGDEASASLLSDSRIADS